MPSLFETTGWIETFERRDGGVRTRLVRVLLVVHLLHGAPARSACGQHRRWGGALGGGVQLRGGDADSTAHDDGVEEVVARKGARRRALTMHRGARWRELDFLSSFPTNHQSIT